MYLLKDQGIDLSSDVELQSLKLGTEAWDVQERLRKMHSGIHRIETLFIRTTFRSLLRALVTVFDQLLLELVFG